MSCRRSWTERVATTVATKIRAARLAPERLEQVFGDPKDGALACEFGPSALLAALSANAKRSGTP